MPIGALALAVMVTTCGPSKPASVSMPVLSYRSELPRVSVYPKLAMPGSEMILVARPLVASDVCLRVIDADAFVWHETCWQGGDFRRITFRPMRASAYVAYLAYRVGDAWATGPQDRVSFCIVGEDAGCP